MRYLFAILTVLLSFNGRGQDIFLNSHEDQWFLEIGGGYSHLFFGEEMDPILSDHLDALQKSFNVNARVGFFVNERVAYNIESAYYASNALTNDVRAVGSLLPGKLEDDLSIWRNALEIHLFFPSGYDFNFSLGLGLNHVLYNKQFTRVRDEYTFSGARITLKINFGFEMMVTERLAFTGSLGAFRTAFRDYNLSRNGVLQSGIIPTEPLSSVDLNVGLRFYFPADFWEREEERKRKEKEPKKRFE